MDFLRKIKVGLLLLVIFAGGGASGVLLDRQFASQESFRVGPRRRSVGEGARLMMRLDSILNLSAEQRGPVQLVVEDWARQVRDVEKRSLTERQALFERYMPLIATNLSGGQVTAYENFTKQVRRQLERRAR